MYNALLDLAEVCLCGRHGLLIDRAPVHVRGGEWGRECPKCGNLDSLAGLAPTARRALLREAARRWEGRVAQRAPGHRQAS